MRINVKIAPYMEKRQDSKEEIGFLKNVQLAHSKGCVLVFS